MAKKRKIALVLSGGGVRGAYATGVIKNLLPRLVDRGEEVDIFCGTSIGSINTTYLAINKKRDIREVVRELEELWLDMDVKNVFKEDWLSVFRFSLEMMATPTVRFKSFCNTTPFRNFIDKHFDSNRLNRNIDDGDIKLFMLSATSLLSGKPTIFYRKNKKTYPEVPPENTYVRFIKTRFSPKHLMASCAVPLVFPYEHINGDYYIDGSVLLNTPLHPILCFDRDIKVIVISLHFSRPNMQKYPKGPCPRVPVALGEFLHFCLISNTFLDIARLSRVNQMLIKMKKESFEKFKVIPYLYIQPSHDVGKLAEKFLGQSRIGNLHLSSFLSLLRDVPKPLLGELLSYVLIDKDYIRSIVQMGERDAAKIDLDKSPTWNKGIP